MEREIGRVNDIINDLMEFSRENLPNLSNGNLNDLIGECVENIQRPAGVCITPELDSDMPEFLFDTSQIQRVLYNLVANAIQAISEGGTVKVITRVIESLVEIEVKDEGVGISQGAINEIFEPLFTTKSKGVGLGLSIVKTFIENHNGSIVVESEVGAGTSFIVKLPIYEMEIT